LVSFAENINASKENQDQAKREEYAQGRGGVLQFVDSRNEINSHDLISNVRTYLAAAS
jgi:hypothetical protein